jgi:hypothetical protein
MQFLTDQGIPVVREDTRPANGYYNTVTRRIGLDHRLEGDQAAKTLVHETAHLVADHRLGMDKRDVETIAESAAFVVLNHAGVDSSDYSFPYIAHWAQDRTTLKRNLDAVQKTAHQIIDALEHRGALPAHNEDLSQNEVQAGNTIENDPTAYGSKEPVMPTTDKTDPERGKEQPQTIWEAQTFVDRFQEVHLDDEQLSAIERHLEQRGIRGRFVRRGDA